MTRTVLAGLVGALVLASPALAQSATDAAKADGKAFARETAAAAQAAATTTPDASRIPNYTTSTTPQSGYFDEPERMAGDAASAAATHSGYRTMRESLDRRARFDPVDLDAAIARSEAIAEDPLAYSSGMSIGGTQGRCVPLPPSTGTSARYTATCNVGYRLEQTVASCAIPLVASATLVTDHLYFCTDALGQCEAFQVPVCRYTGSHPGRCLRYATGPGGTYCEEPGDPVDEYTCSEAIPGRTAISITSRTVISTSRDESQCASLATDSQCTQSTEICSDSDPVTRTIDGVAVTAPCWAWRRDYQCDRLTAAQDCDTLEATPGCTLLREDCLTDDPATCRTWERVYDCPLPEQPASPNQFICDGDVYCVDGSCETIQREANDEFKDAVVALNALAQARREFDPNTLTLFKGTRETCSSKVFGVLNCCKGKGFPLLPGVQLLLALGCSREEILLHQRDAQGLCAYVGSYCSDSVLGVCVTRKKAYCCFESKLSRILQEQGRPQLPKPWDKPKREQCLGFTIDEFARLDLSRMDFSEVYAEFTAAAKLPDELQAASQIQQKIEDYYARQRP